MSTQAAVRKGPPVDTDTSSVTLIVPGPAETDPEKFRRTRAWQVRALGIATPVLFLGLWQVASTAGWIDVRFFPAPTAIAGTAVRMIVDGTLWKDLSATLRALLIGFFFGGVIGLLFGIALGSFRFLRAALEPMFSALYTVPKLAILPILLMVFGLGETPKIILVALAVFFVIWINVLEAVLDIPESYREAAESFGVKGWALFRLVTVPAILPQLFVGLRVAVGTSVLLVIGIEFVNGGAGIGYRIWHSWSLFAADQMYVGVVGAALLGFTLTTIVKTVSKRLVPWAPRYSRRNK